MAKIFTIKINDEGEVESNLKVPDGMSEEDVVQAIFDELPILVARTAMTLGKGRQLSARAAVLDICEEADDLLTKLFEDEDDIDDEEDD